ncbi:MAG: amidohydrolase family protein [Gemmatimonadales bacterium]|nr:amidohydrolase family protein [Candidatus Palauibacter irciniicola]MYC17159.1 amidohydrolase family protein [Gemmatimonadales bacterium]
MQFRTLIAISAAVVSALTSTVSGTAAQSYDLVLAGGRVMDPESGLDAVRHVGIRGGTIAAISESPLDGETVVDVSGLVVAPGFIDLHAHGQDLFSSQLQAQDGVTTALELEGGTGDVDEWYASRDGKAAIHYGATASHGAARRLALGGQRQAVRLAADLEQVAVMEGRLRDELGRGALGLGFGIQYTPGARREEIHRMFQLAAEEGVTSFVHIRYAGLVEPGSSIEAVHEMIANAASTGGGVHIVHIGSSGLGQVPTLLSMIEGAQASGLDVTTEVYPYTAASTDIRAAIFDPGWRERLGGDFGDIEWDATGERLTEETFNERRETGGRIIAHIIPEEMFELALAHPLVMVASDGVPFVNGQGHPRGAGTFARVLGRYVREEGLLTLMDALRKMTLMPAQRLDAYVPQMADKGRIRVGADADITVFDPATVIDNATFQSPTQPSSGIEHVLVAGTFVVRDAELIETAFPGQAIRRD